MTLDYYILDDRGEPKSMGRGVENCLKWAEWLNANDEKLHVGDTWVGEARVYTVFLGLDYNWRAQGPPVFWETMIFNGPHNGECDRCAGGREQAEAMHAEVCIKIHCSHLHCGHDGV